MINKKEQVVENYLRDSVRERGGLCLKLIIMGKRNFPDRTVLCRPGHIFFVELKKEGKDATKTQSWFHRLLKKLGFKVYVCTTKAKVDKILDKEMET